MGRGRKSLLRGYIFPPADFLSNKSLPGACNSQMICPSLDSVGMTTSVGSMVVLRWVEPPNNYVFEGTSRTLGSPRPLPRNSTANKVTVMLGHKDP